MASPLTMITREPTSGRFVLLRGKKCGEVVFDMCDGTTVCAGSFMQAEGWMELELIYSSSSLSEMLVTAKGLALVDFRRLVLLAFGLAV